MLVRVVERADGTLSIIRPTAPQKEGESDTEYLDRVTETALTADILKGRPYFDIEESELPERNEVCEDTSCPSTHHSARDAWRLVGGKPAIDPTVPNPSRLSAHLEEMYKAELNKENPDPTLVTKMQKGMMSIRRYYAQEIPLEALKAAHDAVQANVEETAKPRDTRLLEAVEGAKNAVAVSGVFTKAQADVLKQVFDGLGVAISNRT